MVMRGYRLRPEETAAVLRDGWFVTSDVGELDPSGRLRVLGRRDDLIISGGQKVLPIEVADLLMEHPPVADAAGARGARRRGGPAGAGGGGSGPRRPAATGGAPGLLP